MTRTVETYCGRLVFDDKGGLVAEVYAPGWRPLVGKSGRRCETCWHWHKRQADPGWIANPRCPCFECAGMGYAFSDDLEFWRPARVPKRGRIGPGLKPSRRAILHWIAIRSRRIKTVLWHRGPEQLRRRWLGY